MTQYVLNVVQWETYIITYVVVSSKTLLPETNQKQTVRQIEL